MTETDAANEVEQLRAKVRDLETQVTRQVRVRQELVQARDELDQDLNRVQVLRDLSTRLVAAKGRKAQFEVALSAIIDAFEFECAAAFDWDPDKSEIESITAFSMPRLPQRLPFDMSALEGAHARLFVDSHPILKSWRLGLREALVCPMYAPDGKVEGLLMGARCEEYYDPIREDLGFAFSVLTQQVAAVRSLDAKNAELSALNAELRAALQELQAYRGQLEAENLYLREEVQHAQAFTEIVGSSTALGRVLSQIEQVAPADASVLILGESGTGKELIARAIHRASPRNERPLVKLNCAALPAHLVESELFGHEKGAFTGATTQRQGRFELADGGTIFLDEIGEMPLSTQAKVLRVLQEFEFERVGGTKTVHVDVRVIAATHRDLPADVEAGRFREDLFYRLDVFPIHIPPLRERPEDIAELANHFVSVCARRTGKQVKGLAAASVDRLRNYDWPGNVRELQNVIERAVILARGDVVRVEGLPERQGRRRRRTPKGDSVPVRTMREVETEAICAALEASGWTIGGVKGAARLLDMPVSTLRDRIERYGLRRGDK